MTTYGTIRDLALSRIGITNDGALDPVLVTQAENALRMSCAQLADMMPPNMLKALYSAVIAVGTSTVDVPFTADQVQAVYWEAADGQTTLMPAGIDRRSDNSPGRPVHYIVAPATFIGDEPDNPQSIMMMLQPQPSAEGTLIVEYARQPSLEAAMTDQVLVDDQLAILHTALALAPSNAPQNAESVKIDLAARLKVVGSISGKRASKTLTEKVLSRLGLLDGDRPDPDDERAARDALIAAVDQIQIDVPTALLKTRYVQTAEAGTATYELESSFLDGQVQRVLWSDSTAKTVLKSGIDQELAGGAGTPINYSILPLTAYGVDDGQVPGMVLQLDPAPSSNGEVWIDYRRDVPSLTVEEAGDYIDCELLILTACANLPSRNTKAMPGIERRLKYHRKNVISKNSGKRGFDFLGWRNQ